MARTNPHGYNPKKRRRMAGSAVSIPFDCCARDFRRALVGAEVLRPDSEALQLTKSNLVDVARKSFAQVTGELEDVALIAAEGQAAGEIDEARKACDQLIARLAICLNRLHRLRRQLG